MITLEVGVEEERMVEIMSRVKDNKQLNRLSGRYEIIEQIGVGGMSYVYKAYDSKKKINVAIKILKEELAIDEDFVKKFKSEAIACIDIKQENVISAYDVVDEGNMHYIVMEYFDGITLNKYIKQKEKLSNEEAVAISIQIAKGIKAAHDKGIIHRDIKPQNIVINENGVVKITDFGIARAITSTTKNISVIGTVHYISPEQVRNTKVDYRSDIYSFGCTMYEMITGEVPFEGEAPLDIIISHLRNNLKNPRLKNPNIYKSLEKIIIKASRMIPRERYQSMDEMINDLEMALDNKDGDYIKETNYDDDEEGKTVVITDDDMKVIKAVSEKYSNKQNYKPHDEAFTPEQQLFYDKYIKDGAFRHHMFMRRIIFGAILAVVLLVFIMILIALDTRKRVPNNNVATESIVLANVAKSIDGLDLDFATSLLEEYGITINNIGEEYNNKVEYGKISRIVNDNLKKNMSLDVMVSKGPEVLDFTDKEKLQNTRWSDMIDRLKDRGLTYEVAEINDINVPRGNIVGVNKSYSDELGPLVFTISRGISDQIKTMPNLLNKPVAEARELLAVNELVLGSISYVRDMMVPENCVISQSVEKGTEIRAGSSVDLILSSGVDGVEYIVEKKNKWHSELSATYRVVGSEDVPVTSASNESLILQVRLVQQTDEGTVYTELIEPQEYKIGTILPLIFPNLEGEEKVQNGQVQVVDVERDKVVSSINVMFWPTGG
ncbi:MAG: Stk1 family PASTA domain-containing Ser/Thr kinase [Lachnospiraceae bacterium]|nr:Stk1 family PASTA domain-containing Ser/Thr kinase [Lachnospiraceae bacterium]